jgi:hypothetical protein
LERQQQAGRFVAETPERKRERKLSSRSRGWRKASKGEAQERWELKEASEVIRGAYAVERVAKP